ncbi:hypothetical protein [Anaerotruncus rubiinfantis]|uniref:hypothetical protein n=1 Tax=Anaerotruncus rubiinfantis TaxID=1720200 RepID=UPI00189BD7DC|nr:hypothetical protein [Anaerotruncus rubiinfantis]
MKAIKDRRNLYAALSAAGILLTALLIVMQNLIAAIICGGLTAVFLILLYRQNRLLGATMVIYDSRILTVPSSVITSETRPNQTQAEETIVSTFGLLLGNKVYQWGCEGVYGVRLREVQINKEHICLSFGDDGKMLRVELLHGLTDRQNVMEITQKLWYETRVRAKVDSWDSGQNAP